MVYVTLYELLYITLYQITYVTLHKLIHLHTDILQILLILSVRK